MGGADASFDLDDLLGRLPAAPGVYVMKDRAGQVIYVGKAKDLRVRVRQYFRGGDDRIFVVGGHLRRSLADIETVVVDNEKEALLLENHLIKRHQPRFNVKLRDDKQYLVLRIDSEAEHPRVEVVRNIANDGARYFGPYHSATSCRESLRFINRHFQLRTCTDHVLRTRKRVCLQYQIGRCPGPCVYPIDEREYGEQVEDVMLFLAGKRDRVVPRLRGRMSDHAAREEFESAARLRDAITALEKVLAHQRIVQDAFVDQDVFGLHREGDAVEVAVLFVREGKLIGHRALFAREQELPDRDVLASFVQQYYATGTFIPDEVLLPLAIEAAKPLSDWLSGRRGRKVQLRVPQRGPRAKLCDLARKNAAAAFTSRSKRDEDAAKALEKLQERLRLRRFPRRIECFDIAHLQGAQTVAGMVVFTDGLADKSGFRRFQLRGVENDDVAAMTQVLQRRLGRLRAGDSKWPAPDLLVVDGGKGQLNAALAVMGELGLSDREESGIEAIGLAKERRYGAGERPDAPERVYLRNARDPIRLRPNTAELHLLTRIRDEAHRFANTYHRKKRRSTALRSGDEIRGVGPRRRQSLLTHFGTIDRIAAATEEQLRAAPGMNTKAAEAVQKYFRGKNGNGNGNGNETGSS